jgi:hypothetical protein
LAVADHFHNLCVLPAYFPSARSEKCGRDMSDKLEANDCLEIYESRVRLGFFLVAAIFLTLIGLLMIGACIGVLLGVLDPPRTALQTALRFVAPYPLLLLGVLNIILFGSASIQTTGRLLGKRHPVLSLTRYGFKDIRISSEWIPWSTVLSLNDYRGAGLIERLILDVDPQFVRKLRLGFVIRFARMANRLFGYRGLWVDAFPLENMSTRALLEIMRDRIERGTPSTG